MAKKRVMTRCGRCKKVVKKHPIGGGRYAYSCSNCGYMGFVK